MKDDLHISETTGPRFQLALQRMCDGRPFVLDRVAFRVTNDGCLECAVQSSWALENLSDDNARKDFAHAKDVVARLTAFSPDFAHLTADRSIVYSMIDDYGTGCVQLCRLDGDAIVWAEGIRGL